MFGIYFAEGAYWDFVNLHDATFSQGQISSGRFQSIHEPVVMLLKWGGVIGTGLILLMMYRKIVSSRGAGPFFMLSAFYLLMTFAASPQAGFIGLVIFLFSKDSSLKSSNVCHL